MVAREQVVVVRRSMTVAEVEGVADATGFSRFPVVGTTVDQLLGFIHVKDLLRLPPEGRDVHTFEEILALAEEAGASLTARRALGFGELLEGDVDAMKRRTRNYAKRQLTWMRKLAGVHVIDVTGRDPGALAREILDSAAL
jgi:CBS domain-containing protein